MIWDANVMLIVGFDKKDEKFTLKVNGIPHEKLKKVEDEEK